VSGNLLPYDYDDMSEFSDWLFLEREKRSHLRREALNKLIKRYEKHNDYSTALNYAATLLQLDPISEETYRLRMRLHYLSGNRAEALKTFERCKTVLQTELGIDPLPATQQIAADIAIGLLEPPIPNPQKTLIPLNVLRPPVLVGREDAWQQLESAW
jgi:DNA-binding SARP family transcriptional activator